MFPKTSCSDHIPTKLLSPPHVHNVKFPGQTRTFFIFLGDITFKDKNRNQNVVLSYVVAFLKLFETRKCALEILKSGDLHVPQKLHVQILFRKRLTLLLYVHNVKFPGQQPKLHRPKLWKLKRTGCENRWSSCSAKLRVQIISCNVHNVIFPGQKPKLCTNTSHVFLDAPNPDKP